MEDLTSPSERLLEAGERLFAERGLRATTLRDITEAAGVNVAAVNYYFRTKDALVRAVYKRCFEPLNAERLRLLCDALKNADGRALSLEQVLHAFFEPMVRAWRTNRNFILLVGRLMNEPDPELSAFIQSLYREEVIPAFLSASARAAPDVDEGILFFWIHFLFGGTVYAMLNTNDMERLHEGQNLLDVPEVFLDELIRFGVSGLQVFRCPKGATNVGR